MIRINYDPPVTKCKVAACFLGRLKRFLHVQCFVCTSKTFFGRPNKKMDVHKKIVCSLHVFLGASRPIKNDFKKGYGRSNVVVTQRPRRRPRHATSTSSNVDVMQRRRHATRRTPRPRRHDGRLGLRPRRRLWKGLLLLDRGLASREELT